MNWQEADLNLLPVFAALLRHGSVTLAGRELGLSQPAMSYALKRLRAQAGDPLFVRSGRAMLPTARAHELAQPVQEVLDTVRRRILGGSGFDPQHAAREFSVALTDLGALVFLPALLAELRARAPRCTLRSVQVSASELEGALESGRVDLAIGYYPDAPQSLYQQRLYERDYVCAFRADHPGIGQRLTLARYLALDHVVVKSPVRVRDAVDRALASRGLARRAVLTLPHYVAVAPILEQSDLVATLPREIAAVFARLARVRAIPAPVRVPNVVLRQYWHRRDQHDAANRWLRERVAARFAESGRAHAAPRTAV
ncbi:MAG: LysR family transcriptional regulator [Burkholderiales bacterium]|nr:LysR family transcriptional regulator [Burkholderiales bacterium]